MTDAAIVATVVAKVDANAAANAAANVANVDVQLLCVCVVLLC